MRLKKIRHIGGMVAVALATTVLCSSAIAKEPEAAAEPVLSKTELIEIGHKLASEKCASCHSISSEGESTNKDAPPFRTFADKWPLETLEESLAEGIVTGHEDMPEFVLTADEIVAFLEFLGSLKKK